MKKGQCLTKNLRGKGGGDEAEREGGRERMEKGGGRNMRVMG